jgi:hypothetical protein
LFRDTSFTSLHAMRDNSSPSGGRGSGSASSPATPLPLPHPLLSESALLKQWNRFDLQRLKLLSDEHLPTLVAVLAEAMYKQQRVLCPTARQQHLDKVWDEMRDGEELERLAADLRRGMPTKSLSLSSRSPAVAAGHGVKPTRFVALDSFMRHFYAHAYDRIAWELRK